MSVPYLVLSWPRCEARSAAALGGLLAEIPGWRERRRAPGLQVWTYGPRDLPVVQHGSAATIIGHLVPKTAAPASRPPADSAPKRRAQGLIEDFWGEYVALLSDPDGERRWILRDPSGALDVLTWQRDGVALVASVIERLPAGMLPRDLAIDWDKVVDLIRRPLSASAASPLSGLATVAPGDLQPAGAARTEALALWRPARWAAGARAATPDGEAALKDAVTTAVTGLAAPYQRLLLEVSGGLDSAIVATTLVHAGHRDKVAATLHIVDQHAEGDERRWAQPVLDYVGAPPRWLFKQVQPLDPAHFAARAADARPAFNSLDPPRSHDAADAVRHLAADAIMTGKGGDAVFFESARAAVWFDYVGDAGWTHMFDERAQSLARWLRRSLITLAIERARRPASAEVAAGRIWGPRVRDARDDGPAHPWLEGLETLPAGKRFQIEAILHTQLQRGASPYADVADVLHPLMAQPVLEAVLPIATWDLVRGGRGRGLARGLFADRVPAPVLARRSKGQLSAYFSRTLAASLDVVRPHLIEGCLAEAGVLDRERLDAALRADSLIWAADSIAILQAVAVESWVRHWQCYVPDSAASPRRPAWASP